VLAQIDENRTCVERHSRIGIRERSLDRRAQRRQVAGKCWDSPIVDQAVPRFSRLISASITAAAESAPPRAATAIRSLRAIAASCSAASSSNTASYLGLVQPTRRRSGVSIFA
jgi:hypothetical protein